MSHPKRHPEATHRPHTTPYQALAKEGMTPEQIEYKLAIEPANPPEDRRVICVGLDVTATATLQLHRRRAR